MRADDRRRLRFERPLEIRLTTIDGTWSCEGLLIEISDRDAEIELTSRAVDQQEFFLIMTRFGAPVFRRCEREWVNGPRIGLTFKSDVGCRAPNEVPPEQTAS